MKEILEFDYLLMDAMGELVIRLSEEVDENCFEDYVRFILEYALVMSEYAGRYNISSLMVEYIDKLGIDESRLYGINMGVEELISYVTEMEALSCTKVYPLLLEQGDALYNMLEKSLLSLKHGFGSEQKKKRMYNKVKKLYKDFIFRASTDNKTVFGAKDEMMFYLCEQKIVGIEKDEVCLRTGWEKMLEQSAYYDLYLEMKEEIESSSIDVDCDSCLEMKMKEMIQRYFRRFLDDMKYRKEILEECIKEKNRIYKMMKEC